MTSNGVNKSQTNGINDTPGRLSFPDVRIRDLPFYPVKATLLRPCVLTPKVKDSTDTQNQGLAFYLTQEQANGVNDTPGRLSFPDVRIRDLPFYPVKATLL